MTRKKKGNYRGNNNTQFGYGKLDMIKKKSGVKTERREQRGGNEKK